MMIEVIKPGVLTTTERWRGKCNSCKCEIVCVTADGTWQHPQGQANGHLAVRCPECKLFLACRPVPEPKLVPPASDD